MKLFFVLLLAAPLNLAMSQQHDAPLRRGARLRLVTMDTVNRSTGEVQFTRPEGLLESYDGSSVVLRPVGIVRESTTILDSIRVPMSGIVRAETYTGVKRYTWPGALGGLVVGSIVGYLVATPGASDSEGSGQCAQTSFLFCPPTKGHSDTQVVRTISLGSAGAVAGAIVGHLIKTEDWTQIELAGLRLRLGVK